MRALVLLSLGSVLFYKRIALSLRFFCSVGGYIVCDAYLVIIILHKSQFGIWMGTSIGGRIVYGGALAASLTCRTAIDAAVRFVLFLSSCEKLECTRSLTMSIQVLQLYLRGSFWQFVQFPIADCPLSCPCLSASRNKKCNGKPALETGYTSSWCSFQLATCNWQQLLSTRNANMVNSIETWFSNGL